MGAVKNISGADYLTTLAGNDIIVMLPDGVLVYKNLSEAY